MGACGPPRRSCAGATRGAGCWGPGEFIALAEEHGTIGALGRFVLDEACRTASGWPGGTDAPLVCVNVSPAQLRDASFPDEVADALRRHGLAPRRLLLEVTESVAVQSHPQTRASLDAVRALGVRLALDDFGTGTSSLSHLTQLGVNLVKLDCGFLADVDDDEEQARLVGGVLQLARSLGVPVVAEGLERPA